MFNKLYFYIKKKKLLRKMSKHNDRTKKMKFDKNDSWGLDIEIFDYIYKINKYNNIITTWSNMGCKDGDYDGMMLSLDALNYVSYLKFDFLESYNSTLMIKLNNISKNFNVTIENNKISYQNNEQKNHIKFWEDLTNELIS